ncbi:unnamed protein product [Ilex paraguariensis]|uniref:AAA+ ATPase domain-containing protein n=1 Tax=Ilex paraguariensis TaxID=185542 RepID=A0ABC8SG92_9AQUA
MAEIAVEYLVTKLEDWIFKETNKHRAAEVGKIKAEFERIRPFLKYADWKRLMREDSEIETCVSNIIDLACEVETMIDDDWYNRMGTRGLSLSSLFELVGESFNYFTDGKTKNSSSHVSIALLRKRVSVKLKEMNVKKHVSLLNSTVEARDDNPIWRSKTFACKLPRTYLVGRDREVKMLEEWLLRDGVNTPYLVAVTGDSGIGKTAVTKTVYEVVKRYFDCSAWVFVSGCPSKDIFRGMLMGLSQSPFEMTEKQCFDQLDEKELRRRIRDHLFGKNFLLVLDDLDTLDTWKDVENELTTKCKGKVLITTRNSAFPAVLSTHILHLEPLIHEDALELLRRRACWQSPDLGNASWPSSLEPVVEKILQICEGNPLLVTIFGGMISTANLEESGEWDKVFRMLKEADEFWPRASLIQRVFVVIYFILPSVLKCCFLYSGLFPYHYEISFRRLIRMWVAEGFIARQLLGMTEEEIAKNLLDELIQRNLLEIATVATSGEVISCRSLPFVQDFILQMLNNDNFCIVSNSSQPSWPSDVTRILAVHGEIKNVIPSLNTRSIHSLLLFIGNEHWTPSILLSSLPNIKFLRVLDLQQSPIDSLPDAIGNLVLLRYMSLRGTRIYNLPSSLVNLHELQTLDIRNTYVRALPGGFDGLKMLRHLLLADSFSNRVVKFDGDIMFFKDLQTLAGMKLSQQTAFGLKYLPQLLKLSVGEVEGRETSFQLSKSIDQLKNLNSLTIKCAWRKEIQLQTSNPLENLEKLRVGGWVRNLIGWVCALKSLLYLDLWDCMLQIDPISSLQHLPSLASLLYLDLWDCMLQNDPISSLQHLPSLAVLSLRNAYKGKLICCDAAGGFPNLKKLSLLHLEELEEWTKIEDGAMGSLEILLIAKCPKLKLPPKGFQNLPKLQMLQIKNMPTEFVKEAREIPLRAGLCLSVVN